LTPLGKQRFGDKLDFLKQASAGGATASSIGLAAKQSGDKAPASRFSIRKQGGASIVELGRSKLEAAETWTVPGTDRSRLAHTMRIAINGSRERERAFGAFRITPKIQSTARIPIAAMVRKGGPQKANAQAIDLRLPVLAQIPSVVPKQERIGVTSTLTQLYGLLGQALQESLAETKPAAEAPVETVGIWQ
jgi:hypothetical protein